MLLFILSPAEISAGDLPDPILYQTRIQTGYSKERGYVTFGAVLLETDHNRLIEVLSGRNAFPQWLLNGMGRDAAVENNLKVSLDSVELPEPAGLCRIGFTLFITDHISITNRKIDIAVRKDHNIGLVNHISYRIPDTGIFIKEGGYHVYAMPLGSGRVIVAYIFQIRLARLANSLFNKELYAANIEWYIRKILENSLSFL